MIREQQRREVARLKNTLEGLNKHATYLDDQIKQYQTYLEDCKKKQYAVAMSKSETTPRTSNQNQTDRIGLDWIGLDWTGRRRRREIRR